MTRVKTNTSSNELLSYFSGHWLFKRYLSNQRSIVRGTVCFTPFNNDSLHYLESGFNLDTPFTQERFFVWCNNQLILYKKNYELLHEFDLHYPLRFPIILSHVHTCLADRYACRLFISTSKSFEWHYHVTGPSKHYSLRTCLTKQNS